MTISRRSWHYRVWVWGRTHKRQPTSLCPYFWGVVVRLLGPTAIGAALIWGMVYWATTDRDFWRDLWFTVVVVAVYVVGLGLAAIGTREVGRFHDRRRERRRAAILAGPLPRAPKPPSLLLAFLKAKKAKLCPRITLED